MSKYIENSLGNIIVGEISLLKSEKVKEDSAILEEELKKISESEQNKTKSLSEFIKQKRKQISVDSGSNYLSFDIIEKTEQDSSKLNFKVAVEFSSRKELEKYVSSKFASLHKFQTPA